MPVAVVVPGGAARSSASNSRARRGFVGGCVPDQIALVRDCRGDGGQRLAAPVELLNELAFDARDGVSVVAPETAAFQEDTPDRREQRGRSSSHRHEHVGFAESRRETHSSSTEYTAVEAVIVKSTWI